ncbi:uncharacterized protein [Macrobrachium rosenbergii]|uniref:uncharacterized protein isoform X3 n=1 Tax=Macrobrachium rosenbergii TaxID=79674 RepID=UPI0034D5353A
MAGRSVRSRSECGTGTVDSGQSAVDNRGVNNYSLLAANTSKSFAMAKSGMLYLALVLCAVLATSEALKCFHCNNCGDDAGTPYDCSDNNDVCLKITLAGRVQKSCAQKAACGLGAVERGVVNAWNNLKNLLSDVDQEATDAQLIYCCDRSYCNGATLRTFSPLLVVLTLLHVIRA